MTPISLVSTGRPLWSPCALAAGIVLSLLTSANAAIIDLDFSNNVQATPNYFAPLNANYTTSTTIDFEEVSAGIDIRITVTTIGTGHSYFGTFPDYHSNTAGNPNNDVGAVYYGNTNGTTGGIRYRFDLYQSDGLVNNSVQLTTAHTADEFYIVVYDVDGEASQDERARAYTADGFTSYKLSDTDPLTATPFSGGVEFEGQGVNRSELDDSAATILHYANSSGFTIELEATTHSNASNGVFQAFDGDRSIVDLTNYDPPVKVTPEPASLAMGALALLMGVPAVRRRRRRTSTPPRTLG